MISNSFGFGLVAVVLLNAGMLPQIIRVIKYKDSQAISLLNVYMATVGLFIMLIKASLDNNTFFMINYLVATVLEVALLLATHLYRR